MLILIIWIVDVTQKKRIHHFFLNRSINIIMEAANGFTWCLVPIKLWTIQFWLVKINVKCANIFFMKNKSAFNIYLKFRWTDGWKPRERKKERKKERKNILSGCNTFLRIFFFWDKEEFFNQVLNSIVRAVPHSMKINMNGIVICNFFMKYH